MPPTWILILQQLGVFCVRVLHQLSATGRSNVFYWPETPILSERTEITWRWSTKGRESSGAAEETLLSWVCGCWMIPGVAPWKGLTWQILSDGSSVHWCPRSGQGLLGPCPEAESVGGAYWRVTHGVWPSLVPKPPVGSPPAGWFG